MPEKNISALPAMNQMCKTVRGSISIKLAVPVLGLAVFLGLAHPAQAACRQFAVVGEDASYLLLDGETWAVLRVGNYWVTGVRQVAGVLPGSSDRRTAFRTNGLVSVYDREPLIAGPAPEDGAPNAVALLRMLVYAPRTTPPDYSLGRYHEFLWPPYHYALDAPEDAASDQWVDWLREDTLFRAFDVGGANAVYHLTGDFAPETFVSGEEAEPGGLEVLNVWDIGGMDLSMPFCAADGTLYFTDAANALSVPAAGGPSIDRRPLAALTEEDYRLTPLHAKNCKALASRPSEDGPAQPEYALYDIAADAIESEFASSAPARSILFAGGSLWLQQLARDSGTEVPSAQDPAAEESVTGETAPEEPAPSSTFRLVDTATGEVLREAELDIPGGALIEEMQCDADTPRAVIAGQRRIWLLDAKTLAVVAESEIPFERDYFVFE